MYSLFAGSRAPGADEHRLWRERAELSEGGHLGHDLEVEAVGVGVVLGEPAVRQRDEEHAKVVAEGRRERAQLPPTRAPRAAGPAAAVACRPRAADEPAALEGRDRAALDRVEQRVTSKSVRRRGGDRLSSRHWESAAKGTRACSVSTRYSIGRGLGLGRARGRVPFFGVCQNVVFACPSSPGSYRYLHATGSPPAARRRQAQGITCIKSRSRARGCCGTRTRTPPAVGPPQPCNTR